MENLAAKLTNLSYEIFGIFAPGIIGVVFFLFYWWTLGSFPSDVSGGFLPVLDYQELRSHQYNGFDLVFLGVASYFVGHLLFWLARKHGDEQNSAWKRVFSCLKFRIPRPKESFDVYHRPMLIAVASKLGMPDDEKVWVRFFPIAKVILAQRLTRSLVSTYQNKYTLHRSITAGAALLFWSLALSGLVMLILGSTVYPWHSIIAEARCAAMIFGLFGAILLVWGFSDSFAYNWKMFGNSLITESYALLSGEVDSHGRSDRVG